VSDGGGQLEPEEEPKSDWARHSYRVLMLIDNQVRALRKRQLIDSYVSGARSGLLGHSHEHFRLWPGGPAAVSL
jgi:NTE family protein